MISPMTVPELLREAARVVRQGWCIGALARTREGYPIPDYMDDPAAVSWCALGGILHASGARGDFGLDGLAFEAVIAVEAYLRRQPQGMGSLFKWNDGYARDGDEVAEVFEAVAAELEAR